MKVLTTNELMKHLRSNGVNISGSAEKKQLINDGYYHGYKGYRFYKKKGNSIEYSEYREIRATIELDNELKTLFYPQVMFIETAFRNITLNNIIKETNSYSINDMFNKAVLCFTKCPQEMKERGKRRQQIKKLNLQKNIQATINRCYEKDNPRISHFYNTNTTYNEVPIWAVFEVITMGDLGSLLSCLLLKVRASISREIKIDISKDTNCELVYEFIFLLKDLRNSIAHNSVIFDARFNEKDAKKVAKNYFPKIMNIDNVSFTSIVDYVILVSYLLLCLGKNKRQVSKFLTAFDVIIQTYKKIVSPNVYGKAIPKDIDYKMKALRKYIKNH